MPKSENAPFRKLQTQLRNIGAGGTHASVLQSLANMCREEEKIRDRETYRSKRDDKKKDENKFKAPESFWRRRFVRTQSDGHSPVLDTEKEEEDLDASVFTRYVRRKYRGLSSDQSDEAEKKPVTFSENIQDILLKMTSQFGSDINDAYVSDPSQVMALGTNNGVQAMMKMSQIDKNMKAIDEDMQILQQAKGEQGTISATDRFTGFEHLGEEDCLHRCVEGFSSEDSEDDSEDSSEDDSEGDSESDRESDSDSDSDDSSESTESRNDDGEWESDGDDSSLDSNLMVEMANELGSQIPVEEEGYASVDFSFFVKAVATGRTELPKSAPKKEARAITASLVHSDTTEQANAGFRSDRSNAGDSSADDGSDFDSDSSDSDESGSEDSASGDDSDYDSDGSSLDGDSAVLVAAAMASQMLSSTPTATVPTVSSVPVQLDAKAPTASEDSQHPSWLSSSPLVLIQPPAPDAKLPAPQVSAPPATPSLSATPVAPVVVADSSVPPIPLLSATEETEYQAALEDDSDDDSDDDSEDSDLDDDYLAQFEAILSAAKPPTSAKPKSAPSATLPQNPRSALLEMQEESTPNITAVRTVSSPGHNAGKRPNSPRPQPSAVFGAPSGMGTNVGCFDATGKPNVKAAARHGNSSCFLRYSSLDIDGVLSDLCIAARLAAAADEEMTQFAEIETSKKDVVQLRRHLSFGGSDEDSEASDISLKPGRFFVSFSDLGGGVSDEIKPENRGFIKSGLCEGQDLFVSFRDFEDVEDDYHNEGEIDRYALPRRGIKTLTRSHLEEVNSTEDDPNCPAGSVLVDFNPSAKFHSDESFNLSGSALLVGWTDDDSGLLSSWDDGNDDYGVVEPCEPLVSNWYARRSTPKHPTNNSATSGTESPLKACSTEKPLIKRTVTEHESSRFGIEEAAKELYEEEKTRERSSEAQTSSHPQDVSYHPYHVEIQNNILESNGVVLQEKSRKLVDEVKPPEGSIQAAEPSIKSSVRHTRKSAATAHMQLRRRLSPRVSFCDAFKNLDLQTVDAGSGSNVHTDNIGNEATVVVVPFPKIDFQTKKNRLRSKKRRDDGSLSTRRRRKIRESKQKSKMMKEEHFIEGLCILNKGKGRTVGCKIKSQI